jgi:hypothetical protein
MCLGFIAAAVYWVRPGTFVPTLSLLNMRDWRPIFKTVIAWAPYVAGYIYSKSKLENRSASAIYVYAIFAAATTFIASCFYLNAFHISSPVPAFMISGSVTIALLATALIVASIWQSHTVDWYKDF